MDPVRRDNAATSLPELVLASASPRRAAILKGHGVSFKVLPPPEDDPSNLAPDLAPSDFARALSVQKATAVAQTLDDGLILSGDTVAALGGEVFGKPVDRRDADRILRRIIGTTHEVITALTLLDAATGRITTRHDTTHVTMRTLSDAELVAYLDAGGWKGKAGAYGIQDQGDAFVSAISGSFTNVVGLPIEMLKAMLADWEG